MKFQSLEGNTQKLDGGAMFGNAPKAMWEAWCPPDAQNRIPLACRSLLVTLPDGRKVLCEAGVGAFFDPKLRERFGVSESHHVLLDSLRQVGLTHEDIDLVVLSHLHFDHAGGILSAFDEGPLRLLFPKASFLVSQAQWERAQHPHPRDKSSYIPEMVKLLAESGRLVLVDSGTHPLLPGVRFTFSEGHTPGLMLTHFPVQGPQELVFMADLIPGFAWVHQPLSMGYDRFPERVVDEKKAFLEDAIKRGSWLFFTHDAQHPCGKLAQDAKGRFQCVVAQVEDLAAP